MVKEVILAQFAKIRARILTSDGIDLTSNNDDPTRRLIRHVLGAVSEFEKRILVLRLRAARDRKRNRGERVEGAEPFGHYPAVSVLVQRMRHLRRKRAKGCRASYADIAAQMNAHRRVTVLLTLGYVSASHPIWPSRR